MGKISPKTKQSAAFEGRSKQLAVPQKVTLPLGFLGRVSLGTSRTHIEPVLHAIPLFYPFSTPSFTQILTLLGSWPGSVTQVSPLALQSVFISVFFLVFEFQQSLRFDFDCPVALAGFPPSSHHGGRNSTSASYPLSQLVFLRTCVLRFQQNKIIDTYIDYPCLQRLIIFWILWEGITF